MMRKEELQELLMEGLTEETRGWLESKVKWSIRKNVEGNGFHFREEIAEDAIQESILYLYQNIEEIFTDQTKKGHKRENTVPEYAYIARYARHRYTDYMRRTSKEQALTSILGDDYEDGTYTGYTEEEYSLAEYMEDFATRLTSRDYGIVRHLIDGYTQAEVAELFNLSRVHVARIKQGAIHQMK